MDCKRRNIGFLFLQMAVMLISCLPISHSYTYEQDVYAINNLYAALGSPPLPGWTASGGDPCTDNWQGVQCVGSNITAIVINAANLGGQLGNSLGNFTSIISVDLSNNNIGGSIPEDLPVTMQRFFLSANQLNGSIPSSLSKLTLLTDMSLNNNHLVEEIPDAFQSLTGLVNLDISSNNLSGQLPPSMGSLSSLTSLHMQNNQLSGKLDVLDDLLLQDLNIENNLFSGPVPPKLLNIPNFKKDGNPFNTSPIASPPTPAGQSPSPSPLSEAPIPFEAPPGPSHGTTSKGSTPSSMKNTFATLKIAGCVLGVVSLIAIVLMVIFCLSKFQERKSTESHTKSQVQKIQKLEEPKVTESAVKPRNDVTKASNVASNGRQGHGLSSAMAANPEIQSKKEREQHIIDLGKTDIFATTLPPRPPPLAPPVEKVIVNPLICPNKRMSPRRGKTNTSTSVKAYSIATLQQYTNSFREENLVRESRLGKFYLAELPDGKLLEVMKIDNVNLRIAEDDFLELVVDISELRHPNILLLVGYCAEFGQRLLVYDYFSSTNLHDVLHYGDNLSNKLSWNARLQVALEAAKSLEYLHESRQPSGVHQNFEPANILLDDKLAVCISECGLAALSSNSVTQLSGHIRSLFNYGAPELHETGSCTDRSDVYSFGVVMLELITGRRPYDSSRPRSEQHLLRWASSQLYDIDALLKMVDPSIQGQCCEKELSCLADIISRCIQQGPEFRPPMSEIVQDLTRMVKSVRKTSKS